VFRATRPSEQGAGVDEGLFIGTAGHCLLDEGEAVFAPGEGPAAQDADGERFGEYAYAVNGVADEPNLDFALIRVDDEREGEVNAALCHFGGPTSLTPEARAGSLVHHFGQGLGYGDTVPGPSGAVLSGGTVEAPNSTLLAGAAIFGDSGSPLITADGEALGVVVAILLAAPTVVIASDVADHLPLAERALGLHFEVVTAAFD
jgi:hypothetical protein